MKPLGTNMFSAGLRQVKSVSDLVSDLGWKPADPRQAISNPDNRPRRRLHTRKDMPQQAYPSTGRIGNAIKRNEEVVAAERLERST